ncbi:MAG: HlyD family efflux transporter periplasmic adaptor subunit [Myxococcales bacterium]|nr:HlyD family efflux transporter periplasmic adaptor subunit [Myxococcales bacterium]HRC54734.1 HlyD family efflux transporter periplasmic adaptor subunit [Kofleriaceae bacterium]
MKWIRRLILIVTAAAALAAIVLALLPRPIAVDAAAAISGPMTVTIDELGRTRVKDRYLVSAPLGGVLGRIELVPGDALDTGKVIARITPSAPPLYDARTRAELAARIDIARAGLSQARSFAERAAVADKFAEEELARIQVLAERAALARHEVERAQVERDSQRKMRESAQFAVRAAEHQVALAVRSLASAQKTTQGEELVIESPIKGRVLRVLRDDEGVVAPGTPLVELGDPAALEVVVEVLTSDAVAISPGAAVGIDGWGGAPLRGRVVRVEPSAVTKVSALGLEEQRVTVVIEPASPGWERLGDGFRVEAHIEVWRGESVLQVPASAVFRHGESWALFVVTEGKARLREVKLGRRAGRTVQLEAGLTAGEQVILHPSDRVTDEIGVRIR